MKGAVLVGAHAGTRVLGLPVALRAVLALQSAGISHVLIVGPEADAWATRVRDDDRVKVTVSASDRWPEGGTVVVGEGVVIDAKAARAMLAAGRGATAQAGADVLLAHVHAAGSALGTEPGVPVTDGVVLPARDAREARAAASALLASLRKPQDGWISKLLNRRISLATTRLLVHTSIRPNQLSVLILALGLFGAWLASRGDRASLAWGGVLFQLQSVLDGCDGELSRLTFRGSKTGEWLDTVGDDLTNYAFFGGAAWGLYVSGLGTLPIACGAVGVALGVITSGIEYRYLIRIGSGDLLKYPLGFGNDPEPSRTPGPIARVLGAIRPAFKRDFFVFLAMLMALAGPWTMMVMLVLFVGGAAATFSAVMASEFRRAGGRGNRGPSVT